VRLAGRGGGVRRRAASAGKSAGEHASECASAEAEGWRREAAGKRAKIARARGRW
jgi:hypothetical protein